MSNHYETLQIDKNASITEIKASYKKLALKYHPDKCKAEERERNEIEFKKIQNAYEILSNIQKRQQYDFEQSGGGGGIPFPAGFENIFGNFLGQRSQMYNITVHVSLTLEEVYTGITKSVHYSINEKCEECKSKGYKNPQDVITCNECKGNGYIQQVMQMGFLQQIIQRPCETCHQCGIIITTPCNLCSGRKYVVKDKTVNLKFPKGITHGKTITLKKKGNYYAETDFTTDVIVVANILPHDIYTRDEHHNLFTTFNISLVEALKGFERSIKYLDGTDLSIVSDSIIEPTSVLTYPNRGITESGTLRIKFYITFPTSLDEFLKEIQ